MDYGWQRRQEKQAENVFSEKFLVFKENDRKGCSDISENHLREMRRNINISRSLSMDNNNRGWGAAITHHHITDKLSSTDGATFTIYNEVNCYGE